MSNVIDIAKTLINCESVTPNDAGCQNYIAKQLAGLGFHIEHLPFENVSNLWARFGTQAPLCVFAGHTDVVPPGELSEWHSPPFSATIRDDYLYGRGAADMKGSLAAMIAACTEFLKHCPTPMGSIGFLITSDEEGPAINGTAKVLQTLAARGETIDYCIVGEPSSVNTLGDTIKIGRRGSLTGYLTVRGKQGHVAYPTRALNPIHAALPALNELTQVTWDNGNEHFPATTLQIANIRAGTGATNVIPGELHVDFNLRHCPDSTANDLQQRITDLFSRHQLDVELTWKTPSPAFYTKPGKLRQCAINVITDLMGSSPQLTTDGGTSDGRFIATTGAEVIELGPCNDTIHQINECVGVNELTQLVRIYQDILIRLFNVSIG